MSMHIRRCHQIYRNTSCVNSAMVASLESRRRADVQGKLLEPRPKLQANAVSLQVGLEKDRIAGKTTTDAYCMFRIVCLPLCVARFMIMH